MRYKALNFLMILICNEYLSGIDNHYLSDKSPLYTVVDDNVAKAEPSMEINGADWDSIFTEQFWEEMNNNLKDVQKYIDQDALSSAVTTACSPSPMLATVTNMPNITPESVSSVALIDNQDLSYKPNTTQEYASQYMMNELVKTIYDGDLDKLKHLLTPDYIRSTTPDGMTLLLSAVQAGQLDIVQYLILRGCNVFTTNNRNEDALCLSRKFAHPDVEDYITQYISLSNRLYTSVLYGDWHAVIDLIINHQADVNTIFSNGSTLLLLAVHNNNEEMVRWFVRQGAHIDKQDEQQGIAPLHLAVDKNQKSIANYLIENGANVNSVTYNKITPLHIATQIGNLTMVKFLVNQGADISLKTRDNLTAIDIANNNSFTDISRFLYSNYVVQIDKNDAITELFTAIDHDDVIRVIDLLDTGIDINSSQYHGMYVFEYAIKQCKPQIVELLLQRKAKVFTMHYKSLNALELADLYGFPEITSMLQNYASLAYETANQENLFDRMLKGVLINDLKVVENCVNRGANINGIVNNGQDSALSIAIQEKVNTIAEWMIFNGADTQFVRYSDKSDLLHIAVESDNMYMVRFLLDRCFDIDGQNIYGSTPLHIAVTYNNEPMIDFLVKHGAAIDLADNLGITPVQLAQLKGYHESEMMMQNIWNRQTTMNQRLAQAILTADFKMLNDILPHDYNIRSYSLKGMFPLLFAIQNHQSEMAKRLISKGMNTSFIRCYDRSDLLHISTEYNNLDMVEYFINRHFNVNRKNLYGRTPLHIAAIQGNVPIFLSLLDHGANINALDNDNHSVMDFVNLYQHNALKTLILNHTGYK